MTEDRLKKNKIPSEKLKKNPDAFGFINKILKDWLKLLK